MLIAEAHVTTVFPPPHKVGGPAWNGANWSCYDGKIGVPGKTRLMSSIQATRLRKGMLIKLDADLYRVLDLYHITPGNKRGHVQSRLRDIRSGRLIDHKFRSEDDVERATLDEREMQFLYRDGELFHFMNTESYEQIHLAIAVLGHQA